MAIFMASTKHPVNAAIIALVKKYKGFHYDRVRISRTTGNVVLTLSGASTNGQLFLELIKDDKELPRGVTVRYDHIGAKLYFLVAESTYSVAEKNEVSQDSEINIDMTHPLNIEIVEIVSKALSYEKISVDSDKNHYYVIFEHISTKSRVFLAELSNYSTKYPDMIIGYDIFSNSFVVSVPNTYYTTQTEENKDMGHYDEEREAWAAEQEQATTVEVDSDVQQDNAVENNVYTDGRTDVIIKTLETQYGIKLVKNNLKRDLRRFLRTANRLKVRKVDITSPYCVATVLVDRDTKAWCIV